MTLKDWELKRMDLYIAAYVAATGDKNMQDPHFVGLQAINDFEIAFPRPVRSFMNEGDEGLKS